MKTDFEVLNDIFKNRKIECEVRTYLEKVRTGEFKTAEVTNERGGKFDIEWPEEKSVEKTEVFIYGGYTGFFTVFKFDENQNLESVEAYE